MQKIKNFFYIFFLILFLKSFFVPHQPWLEKVGASSREI